ncbi:MAG: GNAT family N-acetyltransferase [Nakamurella sp.]
MVDISSTLHDLLTAAAAGHFPPDDGSVTVLPQPSTRDAGVIAFTGCSVVFADIDRRWVRHQLPLDDLSAPLNPTFLHALEQRLERRVNNIELLTVAGSLSGEPPIDLVETTERSHPRIIRAAGHRDDLRGWTTDGGLLTLGRGVAGRWEMALEVEPSAQGSGLGRRLATAARHLVPGGDPLWAHVAPGNARSFRALLAAGYLPVGAEALLVSS